MTNYLNTKFLLNGAINALKNSKPCGRIRVYVYGDKHVEYANKMMMMYVIMMMKL